VAVADLMATATSMSWPRPRPRTLGLFMNRGDGVLTPRISYPVGGNSNAVGVALGDMDGDGHADMVVANQGFGKVHVYMGFGDGRFGIATEYACGGADGSAPRRPES
jgi:hypothetical protein